MKNLYRTALPLIVAAVMLVSVLCVGGIGATAAGTFSFTATSSNVTVGQQVTVTACLSTGENGIASLDANFHYDTRLFEYVSCVGAAAADSAGIIRIAYIPYDVYGPQSLTITVTLKAIAAGNSDLRWETLESYDDTYALVAFPNKNISVSVNSPDVADDATLKTLYTNNGTLTPAFDPYITDYVVTVPYTVTSGLLMCEPTDVNASTTVSGASALEVGENIRTVTVTAPSGTTKEYTVVFIREPVTSPDANTPAFAMDSVTALAGQTVTVPLRIVHNPGIIGMRAIVTYDPAVLTPTAMEAQDFVGATFGPLSNPLSVIWFDAINPDNTTDGVVALCTFTVAADAPAGEYPLVVGIADPDDNYNAAWQTVEFATIDGSIRVVDYVAGDANSDSKVNVRDLGRIQQYLNGWAVEVHLEASDVTGDGKVNVRDLGLLQQYLNGWDVTLEHGSGNTTSTTIPTAGPTTQPTTAPTQVQLPLVTDPAKILKDAFALGKNETTPYIAQLTGMVTSIDKEYNDQHGSISVWITVGGQRILCYNMKGSSKGQVKEGDTITVTGVIKNFYYDINDAKGKVEFAWDEASGTEVNMVGYEAGKVVEKTLSIVANPQAGVAYKFGFVSTSSTRGGTYYTAGGMNGYYMATTKSAAAAIDVYLENTTGGYYLYTLVDGKKQYMNMEISGTHLNAVYSDTPDTVYTYDTTLQTLVTTINHPDRGEGAYAFGTHGSYVTIGAYLTSLTDMYFCHFYA